MMAHLLPIATLLVLIAGTLIASRAIKANKELNARRAYFDYVKVAFDNPDFAYPKNSDWKFDHDNQEIEGSKTEYEKYEWFVSLLVVSVEGILEIADSKSVWAESAKAQLEYHPEYFSRYRDKPWLKAKWRTHEILDKQFPKAQGSITNA